MSSATPQSPDLVPTATLAGPTSTATVPAAGGVPVIRSFTAKPDAIKPGEPVTLSWEAEGDLVQIVPLDELGRLATEGFTVSPTGTRVVTTPLTLQNAATWVLFAGNLTDGEFVQQQVSVPVKCQETWLVVPRPDTCPAAAIEGRGAIEPFERGLMIWLEPENRIYALFADGRTPLWDSWPDLFEEGQPESDPSIVPPDDLLQPIRGFGKVWREQRSGGTPVRSRLGWATQPEREMQSAGIQCQAVAKYPICYLKGENGGVYKLEPERSGWAPWATPAP